MEQRTILDYVNTPLAEMLAKKGVGSCGRDRLTEAMDSGRVLPFPAQEGCLLILRSGGAGMSNRLFSSQLGGGIADHQIHHLQKGIIMIRG